MNAGKKILIVEDESLFVICLNSYLEEIGFKVAGIAATGEEAIGKTMKDDPDAILMDIRLAGDMDGLETAEKIRSIKAVPIIFMSGYSNPKIKEQAAKLSAGYLEKPIIFEDIGRILSEIP